MRWPLQVVAGSWWMGWLGRYSGASCGTCCGPVRFEHAAASSLLTAKRLRTGGLGASGSVPFLLPLRLPAQLLSCVSFSFSFSFSMV
jgi:hypothetical protein